MNPRKILDLFSLLPVCPKLTKLTALFGIKCLNLAQILSFLLTKEKFLIDYFSSSLQALENQRSHLFGCSTLGNNSKFQALLIMNPSNSANMIMKDWSTKLDL
jgi:hypothetical protein